MDQAEGAANLIYTDGNGVSLWRNGEIVGDALAAATRAAGHNGVIYPSVRKAGGTCIAALWPNVVQSVVQGAMYRLSWSGTPIFTASAL